MTDGTSKSEHRLRGCLFRLAAMTLIPLVLLLSLEGILRLVGYGYHPDFLRFNRETGKYYINDQFLWSFVPPSIVGSPKLEAFSKDKEKDVFRIFVLGASAVNGTPDSSYSFSRFLGAMVKPCFPGIRAEIMNTGIASINSHVVRRIATDCLRHDPDVLIVYLGNNEVVGPFGPGTVFGGFMSSPASIQARIAIRNLRLGQLIVNLMKTLSPRSELREWQGMSSFIRNSVARDDPRMQSVYKCYEANLRAILGQAKKKGVPVILCTVAVNLRDSAPFQSEKSELLSTSDAQTWEQAFETGVALEDQGASAKALAYYQQAKILDASHAELLFRMGLCYEGLGQYDQAKICFKEARDLDTLRFRADNRINNIIRTVADEQPPDTVTLIDIEHLFEQPALSPRGYPGNELYYEHVHLNPRGNYNVAKALYPAVAALIEVRTGKTGICTNVPALELCQAALALTPWDMFRNRKQIAGMMRRPPFVNQFDHLEKTAATRKLLEDEEREWALPGSLDSIALTYKKALSAAPNDVYIHDNYARLAESMGNAKDAIESRKYIAGMFPRNPRAHIDLGCALLRAGYGKEGEEEIAKGLQLAANPIDARIRAGIAHVKVKQWDKAVSHFQEALALESNHSEARRQLALALMKLGRSEEALREYAIVTRLRPDDDVPHFELGSLYLMKGKTNKAETELREALRINPDHAGANFNLARILRGKGDTQAAKQLYAEALRVRPNWKIARQEYNQLFNDSHEDIGELEVDTIP